MVRRGWAAARRETATIVIVPDTVFDKALLSALTTSNTEYAKMPIYTGNFLAISYNGREYSGSFWEVEKFDSAGIKGKKIVDFNGIAQIISQGAPYQQTYSAGGLLYFGGEPKGDIIKGVIIFNPRTFNAWVETNKNGVKVLRILG